MQKIMFDDHFGLTKAVLEGRKTMTRRIIKAPKTMEGQWVSGFAICKRPGSDEVVEVMALDEDEGMINNILPKYKPGEIVAIAQSYKDVMEARGENGVSPLVAKAGYMNKMYVGAYLMPHQILIKNVRVERLQDISNEDCLREGVVKVNGLYGCEGVCERGDQLFFCNPREAFSALIKKIAGNKAWDDNPYVFVYEFELVK